LLVDTRREGVRLAIKHHPQYQEIEILPLNPRESGAFFLQRILAEKRACLQAEAVFVHSLDSYLSQ
jgi:hypothetical protein